MEVLEDRVLYYPPTGDVVCSVEKLNSLEPGKIIKGFSVASNNIRGFVERTLLLSMDGWSSTNPQDTKLDAAHVDWISEETVDRMRLVKVRTIILGTRQDNSYGGNPDIEVFAWDEPIGMFLGEFIVLSDQEVLVHILTKSTLGWLSLCLREGRFEVV